MIIFPLVASTFLSLAILDYKYDKYLTVGGYNNGLNNKLRVILSYLYKANKENKILRYVWINDTACPCNFEDLFEPIKNLQILSLHLPYKCNYYFVCNDLKNNYIIDNYWALLKPVLKIQIEINKNLDLLGKHFIACHIRRTDGWNHGTYKHEQKYDEDYINFINKCPKNLNIYIATDCQFTQQKFIDLYSDRLIVKKILHDNKSLRQTSVQDAVKDMYICAHSTYFMKSPGSFSFGIECLKKCFNK